MILAISRFRVANGMEDSVRRSFRDRPRLVEGEPGFLGMEVFVDHEDRTVFHLVTRWRDVESYQSWHGSERKAESQRGIPRGLKLDGRFTEVVLLDRIEGSVAASAAPQELAGALSIAGSFLEASDIVCAVQAGLDGRIEAVNSAMADALKTSADALVGTLLWSHLVKDGSQEVQWRIQGASRGGERFLAHFNGADDLPFTLACTIARARDGFLLVGEPPVEERSASTQMLEVNNDLSVLAREHARQSRELQATRDRLQSTLDDLERSYWHLRKIHEVLPICMDCGKVKTTDTEWSSVVEYLKENSLFLTHGYCPDCAQGHLDSP